MVLRKPERILIRIEIRLVEGDHSTAQKSVFMKKATEAVVAIINHPAEDVRVSILEYKPENTSKAGVSIMEIDENAHR